jgi:hypothetical protein
VLVGELQRGTEVVESGVRTVLAGCELLDHRWFFGFFTAMGGIRYACNTLCDHVPQDSKETEYEES